MESTTIVALASGHGVAGVAIIRLSGSHAKDIALKITKRQDLSVRYAHFCHFYYQHGAQLDSGVVLFFKGPHSFTGEDVVELQCHGGALIIKALIDTALAQGATMAKPGAFTERAFLNGKLDLLQAEAVADLIHAQSSAQASAANDSLQGAFSKRVQRLQQQLEA
ncbi:MAG: tRNA uridine-5-carboxymethylaminomethyl(34) synthesis GTPase MnmE, partial [Pseudomonadota bacterium]|nr:tRNA uridine-5-carboxymethylaminomethyl(34) synthesis GTPase MnmE [Pseudomonadota bacterium]